MRKFMELALELAKKGTPSPNPRVGAVLVKNGKIISTGYHEKAGQAHAEIIALKKTKNTKGATLYVTLEPCSHYGRTPPCTKAIISSGIKKVVCAMRDSNPLVNGRGIRALRKNRIGVEVGLMENEARKLNEFFIKYVETGMPFVAIKMAMSLDGKIACNSGDSKWISGEKAREQVHELRSKYDAVMVGIGTVLKDDPKLTCRLKGCRNPIRIVVDGKLEIPLTAKVLRSGKVLIATTEKSSKKKRAQFERKGARVIVLGKYRVDLKKLMKLLAKEGILSVLIEGGSGMNASAIAAGVVDKLLFFVAPKLITGRNASSPIGGKGIESMKNAIPLRDVSIQKFGEDFLFEAYL